MRTVATVIYHSVLEGIKKKNNKVYKNNDAILDEKPPCNEADVIDKALPNTEWYKTKRSAEEMPAIRDVIDLELMKEAWGTKFIEVIITACISFMDDVYAKFFPIFEKEKELVMADQKSKLDAEKEAKNENLAKSQITTMNESKKIISGIKTLLTISDNQHASQEGADD